MRRMPLILSICIIVLSAGAVAVADPPSGVPPDFLAPLEGIQEVPIRVTEATGIAQFQLENGGTAMSYRLIVADITNVVAAHIHLAPRGVNGGVVVFLFGPAAPGGGPSDGTIASGTFTQADFVGSLAGQAFSVLVEAMRTGGAYVNVHTDNGVPPTNSGPGDFPGGEIRGQIKQAQDHGTAPASIVVEQDTRLSQEEEFQP